MPSRRYWFNSSARAGQGVPVKALDMAIELQALVHTWQKSAVHYYRELVRIPTLNAASFVSCLYSTCVGIAAWSAPAYLVEKSYW